MAASAKDWIVSGMTTPAEVQQVLGIKFWHELAEEHGVTVGTLNFDLGGAGQTDRRMKLLLLSSDDALADHLASSLAYGVTKVADESAAVEYLEQHGNVIALVIDSATGTAAGAPEDWLKTLRTQLASSGLPALFVVREGSATLQSLLEHFGAPFISDAESRSDQLAVAVTRLLQGDMTV